MQVIGKKYKYLGLFTSEADAAVAYDRAAVQAKRLNAQTNFDISCYMDLLSAPLPSWMRFTKCHNASLLIVCVHLLASMHGRSICGCWIPRSAPQASD